MKRLLAVVVLMMAVGTMCAQEQAWTAKWIGAPWSTERDGAEVDGSRPMPVFRREFVVKGKVVKAELRIAGLGQYDAWLGWVKDGATLITRPGLHQAWTDYRKTVTYDTYDLTNQMKLGPHVLGVMLGNGMYNVQRSVMANGKARYTKFEGSFGAPKMIAELRLEYADGSSEVVASDAKWKVVRGPVMFSSTYGGEDYDGRRSMRGWTNVGFDDAGWTAAKEVEGPGGKMTAAIAPDVTVHDWHGPLRLPMPGVGKMVFDFGQNFTGWPGIVVKGPAGAMVKLTPGELLNPDRTVSQRSSGAPQWWSYTLRGVGVERWSPQFSYYGFRYLQVEWVGEARGEVVSVTGEALRSASKVTGTFESSNETLNAIHKLIVEAMHNNEVSLFTDCPHREKLGWLEETHLVAAGLMFNDDVEGLYRATDRNIADAQHADGLVPTIAPQYVVFGGKGFTIFDDSPEWGSAVVLAPWAAYRFYGDKEDLARSYGAMKAYVGYLEGRAKDGIVAYGLGDWYDIGPGEPGVSKNTALGVTGTLMLYEDAAVMARIAGILGHAEDAARFAALAETEKAAFERRFWDEKAGWYDKGSQTANAMPLALGIVPEERRKQVLEHLVADIHAHEDHVTTGEVGYAYLLRALMAAGRDDVVMAMMLRKDAPSYGSQLAAGATALTEAWDANPKSSQDHFMLGAGDEWFYRALGGMDVDMSRSEAAERITMRPRVVEGVDWVRCGFASRLGKVESDWRREAGGVAFEVTVPRGVEATVVLPDGSRQRVGAGMHRFLVKAGG